MVFTYEDETLCTSHQPCQPQTIPLSSGMFSLYASSPLALSTTATLSETHRPLSEELGQIFNKAFIQSRAVPSIELERTVCGTGTAPQKTSYASSRLLYREVFTGLVQAIVELFCLRMSFLGCSIREQTALDNIGKRIFQFQDLPSFRPSAPLVSQHDLGELEVQQSIDVWIANHPLSFVLSKALLLYSYRNGFCDRELFAIVRSEADLFLDREDISSTEALFETARTHLLQRLASSASLSTAQALVLLGWHDFCTDRPLQGYCFLELARKVVMQRLYSSTQELPSNQLIDGIDVQRIETELSQSIYWFTLSIALWFSLQISSPDVDIITPLETVSVPASDPSFSAVHFLDSEFGNVVSLVAQKTSIRELWCLAHLTSTIAPIFKLYLYYNNAMCLVSGQNSLPFHRIHSILTTALIHIPGEVDNTNSSLTFTHLAYQLLAIHIAFIRSGNDIERPEAIDAKEILHSIKTFLTATKMLQRQAALQNLFGDGDYDEKMVRWVFLGLDTCGRALLKLRQGRWQKEREALVTLAQRLLEISELQRLQCKPGLATIKERLRQLVKTTEHLV